MAALLKLDFGAVCQDMTMLSRLLYQTEVWEEKGATPRMVLEYCRMHSLGCAIVHNEAVIETLPGTGARFYRARRTFLLLREPACGQAAASPLNGSPGVGSWSPGTTGSPRMGCSWSAPGS